MTDSDLRVEERGGGWVLSGPAAVGFELVNDYLGYLADRRYSPRTVRAYAFDLLAFCRWLLAEDVALGAVRTEMLLRYLAHCRTATFRGRPGGNVYSIRDGRNTGYAAATVNRRMVAISGLFEFRSMRDPDAVNPVPRGAERRRTVRGERGGLLGHLATAKPTSRLRVRQPRRLPRALDAAEASALLGSFHSWRDQAMGGLMLLSGLRSAEVLALKVADVDIPRGWVRVVGKGDKERRVPVDAEVAGLIQTYLLAERPEGARDGATTDRLFVVAKGPNRGRPLTPEGLRAIFRYHRARSGVSSGHPHALRHSFGTALAEAGVDLAVIQTLMGHDHIDSSARYVHLAPAHVRAAYDDARTRQRRSG
ncbi:integrase [Nonomuraea mesophila]|uniref:Integrase n=1 Tax=Nonomuraea mesophila TaxID=2530382 RepID=A0A4V6PGN2_9ACTN|nr:tyrosine-type recombinase/integrase [Nonomuraea mesophila]TDE60275.1 integrase [Nonomuraea mesophila]